MKRKKLGFGFADGVFKVTSKMGNFKKVDENWKDSLLPNYDSTKVHLIHQNPWRVTAFLIFSLILFFILFLKIFHLQIISGRQNRELADGNRIKIKLIHAPRGVIYDRNGKILASNSPAFRLFDTNPLSGGKKAKIVSREEALKLEVNNDPRAKDLEVDNVRFYPEGEEFAHVLGYVGEISEEQLKGTDYHLGDRVGKAGIEKVYEKVLRGKDGGEIIEVNSQGEKIRSLRVNPPIAGENIYLNIDALLQDKLFKLTKEQASKVASCCGAVVGMNPQNGQILTLFSLPSFDPNAVTKGDESAVGEIFSNHNSPILNRTISGAYPPGSTFKIVSSLAALTSGKISPDRTFEDNGVLYLGPYKFSNWYFNEYGKVEGSVNLLKAIQRSNDIYFYEISQIIGKDAIFDMAKKLKMGNKLNIDLPSEEVGLIPNDEWKRKTFNESWYPGDTLHLAIGQGFVLTTPLQILGITSFIGNNGILYQPQLVNKITFGNSTVEEFKSKVLISNLISSDKINLVKQGLEQVTKNGGTAWPFFTFPIPTAGKTGTAEYGDPKNHTHAWYTSYAPANNPKIALTVLVEGGGEGSNVSAPIAKEAYRWYFSEDKNKLIQDSYVPATDSGKTLGE